MGESGSILGNADGPVTPPVGVYVARITGSRGQGMPCDQHRYDLHCVNALTGDVLPPLLDLAPTIPEYIEGGSSVELDPQPADTDVLVMVGIGGRVSFYPVTQIVSGDCP